MGLDEFFQKDADEFTTEFFAIADNLVSEQANSYLDSRLAQLDEWAEYRQANGQPADLRSLITQVVREPNQRGPVIVALCTALWRLREMKEKENVDGH